MKKFIIEEIPEIDYSLKAEIENQINQKTKPVKSLGEIENLAKKICLIQNTINPKLINPHIVVFAGDHGITKEGVSAYPQDVTWQMVENFLARGAAINVFAKNSGIKLIIVDAGVNHDFRKSLRFDKLVNAKINDGTKSFLNESAMTEDECLQAFAKGGEIVEDIINQGCNIIGFGEMGIGNTSSSAILCHLLSEIPLNEFVGKGTGLDAKGIENKTNILYKALNNYLNNLQIDKKSFLTAVAYFSGFEIVMMAGAMYKAAFRQVPILVDGFISTTAFAIAHKLSARIFEYAIFSHISEEAGHKKILSYLGAKPLVNWHLCLGEGTGAALIYPIVVQAVSMVNKMSTFSSAHVSKTLLG